MAQLPRSKSFARFDAVDLDADGRLLVDGEPVPADRVDEAVQDALAVEPDITDIFVFVHGWQNPPEKADEHARRLFEALDSPETDGTSRSSTFVPQFISIRWPSMSTYSRDGYRLIRNRAHAMATTGHAAHVLGSLLGYLNTSREDADLAPVLQTAGGQYLHCVGHSFGCRLLGEAIRLAAKPPKRVVLDWTWPSDHPFTVDSFIGLQMAAPPSIFEDRFADLVSGRAPITGPIVLTMSDADQALSTLHRLTEKVPGIGAVGADGGATIKLHRMDEPYRLSEFARVTNVDASWLFRGGWPLVGAHAKIWYPETVHLVRSVAELARPQVHRTRS